MSSLIIMQHRSLKASKKAHGSAKIVAEIFTVPVCEERNLTLHYLVITNIGEAHARCLQMKLIVANNAECIKVINKDREFNDAYLSSGESRTLVISEEMFNILETSGVNLHVKFKDYQEGFNGHISIEGVKEKKDYVGRDRDKKC